MLQNYTPQIVMTVYFCLLTIYLLLSRRNAFGEVLITNPKLRRETGVITAIIAICYICWMVLDASISDSIFVQVCSMTFDVVIALPLVVRYAFVLLQDKPRWKPWYGLLSMPILIPFVGWLLYPHQAWLNGFYGMLACYMVLFTLVYIRSARAYQHYLLDNYADIERKEIHWVLIVMVLIFILALVYALAWNDDRFSYLFFAFEALMIAFFVWHIDRQEVLESVQLIPKVDIAEGETPSVRLDPTLEDRMAPLLQKHCEETLLYTQHDLSLTVLAQACGTNRTYLSQYFASQGTTYHGYINQLRIRHFMDIYVAAQKKIQKPILQDLASQCGFRNYNTFTKAFQSYAGMNMRDWLLNNSAHN